MTKSSDAFRTISEVAAWLETQAHVLRFWESKFGAVNPVQRTGGRRYYRKSDMTLLGGIKFLLHERGMTIKAVQKLLKDEGVAHLQSFSAKIDVAKDFKPTGAPMLVYVKDEVSLELDEVDLNKNFMPDENWTPDEQPLLFPELEKQFIVNALGVTELTADTMEPKVLGANLSKCEPQVTDYTGQLNSVAALLKLTLGRSGQKAFINSEILEKLRNIQKKLTA